MLWNQTICVSKSIWLLEIQSIFLMLQTILCLNLCIHRKMEHISEQQIQEKVQEAGIEIIEARITYLAYAPEIAAVMLQRQQASAIIDARKMIVDGAVGMVEMALERLDEHHTVELDE